jgi:hypothetical protein
MCPGSISGRRTYVNATADLRSTTALRDIYRGNRRRVLSSCPSRRHLAGSGVLLNFA